jgi:putative DNA methylase
MSKALKSGAPLAFTYHHNRLEAYYPVAVAVLDAGMTCSASLPCPAEMEASIHINGTGSSIIDTIFVCRTKGVMLERWLAHSVKEVARIVEKDLDSLFAGNVKPTLGDVRCITYGHLIRLAIWALRDEWDKRESMSSRIGRVAKWLESFGAWAEVEKHIGKTESATTGETRSYLVNKSGLEYGAEYANVSF